MRRHCFLCWVTLSVAWHVSGTLRVARCDQGKPVAVRWWGKATVSVETYWHLTALIEPSADALRRDERFQYVDLVLTSIDGAAERGSSFERAKFVDVDDVQQHGGAISGVLDRPPNARSPSWRDARQRVARSPHALVATGIGAESSGPSDSQRPTHVSWIVDVDGVRIAHHGSYRRLEPLADALATFERIDVLLIPIDGQRSGDVARFVERVDPRVVVPLYDPTAPSSPGEDALASFLTDVGQQRTIRRTKGNTLSVRATTAGSVNPKQVVLLRNQPWEMSPELADLFARKEAACRAAQRVFARLSTKQMNFRPSNGTHTPRWNAEHMMGRELGFFSEIFAELDPMQVAIDLNPAQMPPDYQAAHADWTGEEEARQMERVAAYTRRFAYLLAGLELDDQAPGSFWTLRRLLLQMERHYHEHTANVVQKFSLSDWPVE